jgi:sugar phosphate isomerase/epimerase
MIHIGMHTDNWRTLSGSIADAVASAKANRLKFIEFGVVDGQDFVQGLGYAPSVSLHSNPIRLKRYLDANGLNISQIDAGFPITGPLGASHGVRYVQKAIQFAADIGCPRIDTTDGATKPQDYADEEILAITRNNYRQILEWADDYAITITVEPHGPFTNDPDTLARILDFSDRLRVNFDTGNTFIAGHDPVAFLRRFIDRVDHVHCKDVTRELMEAVRGGETGIPMSESAVGDGVNADNIAGCIEALNAIKWEGVFSIECLGTPTCIKRSVDWLSARIGKTCKT